MSIKKLPLEEFQYIYSKVPRLCVDVVLKTEEGILLSKRDITPAKGMWHLPGGTVYFGETHEEAVKRVAKEEMGIEVEVVGCLGVIEYGTKYSLGWTTAIAYLVEQTGGKFSGSYQAKELKFFKAIPDNTIPEPAEFLKKHFGMK